MYKQSLSSNKQRRCTVNSSIKHPILQHLPSELLNNPERNAVQAFLKKVHTFNRLKIAMIVAFIVYMVLLYFFETVHTTNSDLARFDYIFNLFPLALFSGLTSHSIFMGRSLLFRKIKLMLQLMS